MNINVKTKDFVISPQEATNIAQELHEDIGENGNIDKEQIIDIMAERIYEEASEWLEENIDWQKIEDDDNEAREYIAERNEAAKGDY